MFFCNQEFLQIVITLSGTCPLFSLPRASLNTCKHIAKLGLPPGSKADCELCITSRKTSFKEVFHVNIEY